MRKNLVLLVLLAAIFGCKSTTERVVSLECSTLNECVTRISTRVQQNAKWICDNKSNDKKVKISTALNRNGEIKELTILLSSGDEEFNNGALKAIRDSAPFIELSALSEADFLEVSEINFSFIGNTSSE